MNTALFRQEGVIESMGSTRKGAHKYDPVLQKVLAGIPTAFGRLVWVSSLRVGRPYEYRYPDLEQNVPTGTISGVLRSLHFRLFIDWLALGLDEKCKDFTEYSEAIPPADRKKLSLKTSENLIPSDARKAERYLFETDIAVVLELAASSCPLCGGRADTQSSGDLKEMGTVVRCAECGTYGLATSYRFSQHQREGLSAYVRREAQRGRTMPVIREDNLELLLRLGEQLLARAQVRDVA